MPKDRLLYKVAFFAALLALCVVILGAFTRLKDAGLGCPDWPGCYGHLTVPKGEAAQTAGAVFGQVVEAGKAWAEMVHRYIAGTLGVLILFIMARALITYRNYNTPVGLPIFIVLLVVFQAALGRWTVTLKLLPPIVMLHLLGGMTLVTLLSLLALRLGRFFGSVKLEDCHRFRWWVLLGLLFLIIQIMLGGWTSTNYAALVCQDFPYCGGQLIPALDFSHAFTILDKIGVNYQGGVLNQATRITIQFTHRVGAIVVFSYWLILSLILLGTAQSKVLFRFAALIIVLLIIQVSLGIMNVVLQLPLHVAVSHNAVATLLLVTIMALNYALYPGKAAYHDTLA